MTGKRQARKGTKGSRGVPGPMAGIISLGCSKNLVDTEYLMGGLAGSGWGFTPRKEEADLLLVNTCSFLEASLEESRAAIGEALEWKAGAAGRIVVVAGCIVSRCGRRLEGEYPGVDLFLLPGQNPRLPGWLASPEPRPRRLRGGGIAYLPRPGEERVVTTPDWAYLKISDGCTNRCSYCLIPSIRGPHKSRSLSSLRREVKGLVEAGVREINLVGQDLTRWGEDRGSRGFEEMASSLASLPGEFRLRLLYLHPSRVGRGTARLLAEHPKIFPYLDMPIQHASERVLAAMNRSYDRRRLEEIWRTLKESVPSIALRTTVMVGYPGERKADYRELLRFLRECPFENLGAFIFDPQEGTAAASLPGRVEAREARDRYHELMEQQQSLSARLWRKRRGTVTEAIVLAPLDEKGEHWVGRTAWQAPEVDGEIVLEGPARPGDLVRVEITGSSEYDLQGVIVDEAGTPPP